MRFSSFVVLCGVASLALAACGGESTPPPGVDGGPPTDFGGGSTDARVICASDVDCNDGLFCNGREMCAPASDSADMRGCVPGDAPCSASETCDEMENDCRTTCEDVDGDGHEAVACGGDDCADTDASRYPGNVEVCNTTDEDCNDATLGFVDADGDGVASSACCNGTACGGDCNDGNADIRPGALDGPPDLCNTLDDDCDGSVDEGCPCTTGTESPCYTGAPSTRGVGRCADGFQLCVAGMLQLTCNNQRLPDAEICDTLDNDCDGVTNEDVLRRYYRDGDADGFGVAAETIDACSPPAGFVSASNDCDDDNANINPGAFDACNMRDDDCDGMTDESAPSGTYYRDDDRDGYGRTTTATMACSAPTGYVPASGDCDDTRAGVSPVGVEVCDAAMADEDCDAMFNEFCICVDGTSQACGGGSPVRGACRAGVQRCIAGLWAGCAGNVDPGTLTETCNGVDDDCDGTVDETLLAASCFTDGDSDGYGAGTALTTLCRDAARPGACPSGYSNVGGDCNDANAATRPMGAELCDAGSVDDDCDGSNNEGCACANGAVQACGGGGRVGVGICRSGTQRCVAGAWLPCEGNVEPAASETCNGIDDNCIGGIDEGVTMATYVDADGDTYGVGASTPTCLVSPGFASRAGDCNDANPAVRPGSVETCNGIDDNCNSLTDEGLLAASCLADADSDAYGAGAVLTTLCRDTARPGFCPSGYSNVGGDCNDSSGATHPLAAEVCNGSDEDCDAVRDEGLGTGGSTVCYLGQTQSCVRMCGAAALTGTQRCLGDCSGWSDCILPEVCNGCDDDGDGSVDNGFFCPRNQITYCDTVCDTSGQRICNATCSAYLFPDCRAVSESCNFCDDDGDFDEVAAGTTIEPEDEAVSTTVVHTDSTCAGWTLGGVATCSGSTITMTNGLNDVAGAWAPPLYFGWGKAVAQYNITIADIAGGVPGEGFAILLTSTAPGALIGTATRLGAPLRPGLLIEWRFNGAADDTISLGQLSTLFAVRSSHTITAASPLAAYRVGSGTSTAFTLELTYEATPLTGSRGDATVTLIETSGNRIPVPMTPFPLLGVGADILTPGSQVWTGFFAATGAANDANQNLLLQSFVFNVNPPTNVEFQATCDTFTTP